MSTEVAVIHRVRVVASFALLGAVLAGVAGAFPLISAVIPAALDIHAIGAVIGGIAGTVTQAAHSA